MTKTKQYKEIEEITPVPFEKITSEYKDKPIFFEAYITQVTPPQTVIDTYEYYCTNCRKYNHSVSPMSKKNGKCVYCGKISTFVLNTKKSTTKEIQEMIVSTPETQKQLKVLLNHHRILKFGDDINERYFFTGKEYVSWDNYHAGMKLRLYGKIEHTENEKGEISFPFHCYQLEILDDTQEDDEVEIVSSTNRYSPEYNKWVNTIKTRDKVCQICGGHKHLEAHHMYSYQEYPKLRLDEGNGILLCSFCHQKFHSYYGKNVTPSDLVKFIFEFRR